MTYQAHCAGDNQKTAYPGPSRTGWGVCRVGSAGCRGSHPICTTPAPDNGCGTLAVADWPGETGGCRSEAAFFGPDLGDGDIVHVWTRQSSHHDFFSNGNTSLKWDLQIVIAVKHLNSQSRQLPHQDKVAFHRLCRPHRQYEHRTDNRDLRCCQPRHNFPSPQVAHKTVSVPRGFPVVRPKHHQKTKTILSEPNQSLKFSSAETSKCQMTQPPRPARY